MGILLPFFRFRLHALYSVSTERVFTVPQGVTGFRNSANTRFSEFEGNHGRGLWTTKSGKKIFHELAKLSRSQVNDILEGKRATGAASCYSLSSPWCRTRTKTQRLPPTSPGRGPRFPDPRNPPSTEKGAAPRPDPSFHLTLLSRVPDPQGARQRARPNTRDPRPGQ